MPKGRVGQIAEPHSLGGLLRLARQESRVSMYSLSKHIKIGSNTLTAWEKNERVPAADQLRALWDALAALSTREPLPARYWEEIQERHAALPQPPLKEVAAIKREVRSGNTRRLHPLPAEQPEQKQFLQEGNGGGECVFQTFAMSPELLVKSCMAHQAHTYTSYWNFAKKAFGSWQEVPLCLNENETK